MKPIFFLNKQGVFDIFREFRAKIGRRILSPEPLMDKRNTDVIGRQSGRQKRKAKGTIKIESDKGWLRLRFTHAGKRRAFALGLPDSNINRKFAEQKAKQIELDILSGNFDTTLQKYKPQKTQEEIKADLVTAEDWIGESLSRGIRKATKTNRARTITLTPRLRSLLLSIKSKNQEPENLSLHLPKVIPLTITTLGIELGNLSYLKLG